MAERQKTRYPGIYKLEDGRYMILATKRDGAGNGRLRMERTLPLGTRLEDARKARDELGRELLEEAKNEKNHTTTPEAKTSPPTTVADYAERWMAEKAARLKKSVSHHYMAVLSMHILPRLGERVVTEVTRADIEAWVAAVEGATTPAGRSYSRHTLEAWFRVLATMMRDAAADLRFPDPVVRVRPPRTLVENIRENRTLTRSELATLLDVTKAHFPEWHAEVSTLALTGMRPGELYALIWDDIRFEAKTILVRRAVWKGYVSSVKTGVGRTSALPDDLAALLREHKDDREEAGHPVSLTDLVFPSIEGTARATSALFKMLGIAGEIAKIPQRLGPQVLRRTLNTLLIEAGVSAIVVRSQMGHTTDRMTQRYAGIHVEAKLAGIESVLSAGKEVPPRG